MNRQRNQRQPNNNNNNNNNTEVLRTDVKNRLRQRRTFCLRWRQIPFSCGQAKITDTMSPGGVPAPPQRKERRGRRGGMSSGHCARVHTPYQTKETCLPSSLDGGVIGEQLWCTIVLVATQRALSKIFRAAPPSTRHHPDDRGSYTGERRPYTNKHQFQTIECQQQ